jgi:hypothetical protein
MDNLGILAKGQFSSKYFTNNKSTTTSVKNKKVKRTHVSKKLRKTIWHMHAGPHKTSMICMGCNLNTIQLNETAGWEACHIVADAYYRKDQKPTQFDLLPMCRACNLEMGNTCIWEWFVVKNRITQLKRTCYTIYNVYKEVNAEMSHSPHQNMCWKLIMEVLHGPKRFPDGGYVRDEYTQRRIIHILKIHQQQHVQKELTHLVKQIGEKQQLMQHLLE